MKTRDVLETVEWAQKHFGSLTTNRQCTRRDVMREVARGYLRSTGLVPLCDDDGGTLDPERYREGFVLTDTGRAQLLAASEEGT